MLSLLSASNNSPFSIRDDNSPPSTRDDNSPPSTRDDNSPPSTRDDNSPLSLSDNSHILNGRAVTTEATCSNTSGKKRRSSTTFFSTTHSIARISAALFLFYASPHTPTPTRASRTARDRLPSGSDRWRCSTHSAESVVGRDEDAGTCLFSRQYSPLRSSTARTSTCPPSPCRRPSASIAEKATPLRLPRKNLELQGTHSSTCDLARSARYTRWARGTRAGPSTRQEMEEEARWREGGRRCSRGPARRERAPARRESAGAAR